MEDGDQVDAHLEQVCCPLLCMRVLTPLIMCSLVVMHTRVCDRLSSGLGVHHILRVFLYLPGLSPVVYQVRNADLHVVLHLGQLGACQKLFAFYGNHFTRLQTSELILYALTLRF